MHPAGENAEEEILLGGRLTAGVLRIGDTVRRPVTSSSPFTARLLAHLANIGFDGT
ncbi:MAG: aminoglycoside phosphotransferase family protein, partial [Nitrospira sp. LK265]|nr:aminoglycoside phosphotransferase family protein [Nitrospira sp. LK265]